MREACDLEQSVFLHVWVRNQAGGYFLELRIRRKMGAHERKLEDIARRHLISTILEKTRTLDGDVQKGVAFLPSE